MQALNFKKYCPEHYQEILNYALALKDDFDGWVCHHINGEQFTRKWLKKNNMYFNRTDPHEFRFMTKAEHEKLHKKGKHRSEATRKKIAEARKGQYHSDEVRKRISAANQGQHRSEETKQRISESKRGENHPFYGKQHTESYRSHMAFLSNERAEAFRKHKANGGTLTWNMFQKEYKNGLQACPLA